MAKDNNTEEALFAQFLRIDSEADIAGLNWQDIERESLHCAVLQALRHLDKKTPEKREQLMIWTLLWFSRVRREMMEREIQRVMREPARHV